MCCALCSVFAERIGDASSWAKVALVVIIVPNVLDGDIEFFIKPVSEGTDDVVTVCDIFAVLLRCVAPDGDTRNGIFGLLEEWKICESVLSVDIA